MVGLLVCNGATINTRHVFNSAYVVLQQPHYGAAL